MSQRGEWTKGWKQLWSYGAPGRTRRMGDALLQKLEAPPNIATCELDNRGMTRLLQLLHQRHSSSMLVSLVCALEKHLGLAASDRRDCLAWLCRLSLQVPTTSVKRTLRSYSASQGVEVIVSLLGP